MFDYTGNENENHEVSHKMLKYNFAIIVIEKLILSKNACNSAHIYIGIPVKLIQTWTPNVNSWHDIDCKIIGVMYGHGQDQTNVQICFHVISP